MQIKVIRSLYINRNIFLVSSIFFVLFFIIIIHIYIYKYISFIVVRKKKKTFSQKACVVLKRVDHRRGEQDDGKEGNGFSQKKEKKEKSKKKEKDLTNP